MVSARFCAVLCVIDSRYLAGYENSMESGRLRLQDATVDSGLQLRSVEWTTESTRLSKTLEVTKSCCGLRHEVLA